ncbi:MAG: NAD(P)/FAD-dependent oxidoreductase [Methanothrix sp.]|jgi:digeranylgeranylglycerophospholipid reductase|nr:MULTISPECIES: NAD(P)/FAD-dependent oxidoreductase [Methanothrix]MBC7080291.1 NAD(P)/FAD-dependent oxidoreductase [Methanothrix sp.]NPU87670.1 NAD(P)/FAD-dependent oxidoreductase [Methanothrix sp.]
MRKMKFDVAVVGASPAGLSAAASSARTDARTVLIDRDLTSVPNANTIFEGMASAACLNVEPFSIHQVRGMRLISPSGHSLEIDAGGHFLDRKGFYAHYLNSAADYGAEIIESEVRSVSRSADGMELFLSTGDVIDARIVIDAAGVDSQLASSLGIKTMRHPDDVAWAIEVDVRHPGIGEEDRFEYWVGSIAPGWKATFSPAGEDMATLGVFVRRHGRDVQRFLETFLKKFISRRAGSHPGLERMRILGTRRGGDPIAVLPGRIVDDGIMVTGGAAAQSGLAYSMRAGEICGDVAGRAALERDPSRERLSEYSRRWWRELGFEYILGRASLERLRSMSDDEIDRLFISLSGRNLLVPGGLWRKSANAAFQLTKAMPSMLPRFLLNLLRF